MNSKPRLPVDPLRFIQECARDHRVFWSYHVNMRMKDRAISREVIMGSIDSYEIIEAYPDDKYLPSFLVYSQHQGETIHVLFAIDNAEGNVRIVTAYHPDPERWDASLKKRRTP